MEALADRVRRLRLAAGLSQTDLAGEDLSPSYVSLIEAGRRTPTARALALIADRLGTTAQHLETGVDPYAQSEWQAKLQRAQAALAEGSPHEALDALAEVAGAEGDESRLRTWLTALAYEQLGELREALTRVEQLHADSAAGTLNPTATQVAVALTRLYREAGDRTLAERVGEDVLNNLTDPELATEDGLRLAATLIATYVENGNWTRADLLGQRITERADMSGGLRGRGAAYWAAAQAAEAAGRLDDARAHADRAVALFAEEERDRNWEMVQVFRAWLILRHQPSADDANELVTLLRGMSERLSERGDAVPLAYARQELARALLHTGQAEAASVEAELAAATFASVANTSEYAHAQIVLAQALLVVGRHADAAKAAGRVAAALQRAETRRGLAAAWTDLGVFYELSGDYRASSQAYREALAAGGHVVRELASTVGQAVVADLRRR